jgi:hypothetical protein
LLRDEAKKDSTGTRKPAFCRNAALPSNTDGSLILGTIQIIVEIGGLSNDEVHTNSNRGSDLRIIVRDIRNFATNPDISRRQNRVASRGPILPATRWSGFFPIDLPGKLPVLAHLVPLISQNR